MPVIDFDESTRQAPAPNAAFSSHSLKFARLTSLKVSKYRPFKKRRHLIGDNLTIDQDGPANDFGVAAKKQTDTDNDLTNLNWLQDFDLRKTVSSPLDPCNIDGCSSRDNTKSKSSEPKFSKPPFSYSALIYMAIESSSTKFLLVRDIYKWIIANFPYFATAPTGNVLGLTVHLFDLIPRLSQVGRTP